MKRIVCCVIIFLFISGCLSSMTAVQKEKAVDFAIEVGMLAVKVISAFPPEQIIGLRSPDYDSVYLYPDRKIAVYISGERIVRIEDIKLYSGPRVK